MAKQWAIMRAKLGKTSALASGDYWIMIDQASGVGAQTPNVEWGEVWNEADRCSKGWTSFGTYDANDAGLAEAKADFEKVFNIGAGELYSWNIYKKNFEETDHSQGGNQDDCTAHPPGERINIYYDIEIELELSPFINPTNNQTQNSEGETFDNFPSFSWDQNNDAIFVHPSGTCSGNKYRITDGVTSTADVIAFLESAYPDDSYEFDFNTTTGCIFVHLTDEDDTHSGNGNIVHNDSLEELGATIAAWLQTSKFEHKPNWI